MLAQSAVVEEVASQSPEAMYSVLRFGFARLAGDLAILRMTVLWQKELDSVRRKPQNTCIDKDTHSLTSLPTASLVVGSHVVASFQSIGAIPALCPIAQ